MARVVLLALLVCLAVAQDTYFVPSILYGGFEVIWSNDTSFIDEIDMHGGNIYVAAQGEIREVTLNPFQLSYNNRFFTQAHRFIDFRAFDDTSNPPNTWVFGPTDARGVYGDFTVNHPIQLSSLASNDTEIVPNFLLSSVTVRAIQGPTGTTTVAYLAGWEVSTQANFVVASFILDPTKVAQQSQSFATLSDFAVVYNGSYADFSRPFKPRIFRSHVQQYVLVVDPNSRKVYKINTEDTKFSLSYSTNSYYTLHGHVSGVAFDHDNARLFVGTHERGTRAASIVVINTDNLTLNMTIHLRHGESYPKALGYRNNVLYAGINGGHAILQIDVSQVNGSINYATLPWYLRNLYSLTVSQDGSYVYFGTYEQRAKVARVRASDFCFSVCDTNFGFCAAARDVVGALGECQCVQNYVLNEDGYHCDQNATIIEDITQNSLYKQARAGNVALGLLFAATFIVAAIGWFMLWRHKKGDSGSSSKRYSSVANTEEHENFLGNEEE